MLVLRFQNCNSGTRKKDLIEALLSLYKNGLWYEYYPYDMLRFSFWYVYINLSFLLNLQPKITKCGFRENWCVYTNIFTS